MRVSPYVEEMDIADVVAPSATLPDLPNELLFLIIEDLDNDALLNLGLTCRRMNFIAFNRFFVINTIRDPGGGWFNPYGTSPPPVQTLPILRSALYVTHLRYFDFALNTGMERMRSEVSDIRVLAARLQKMGVFKISFHLIDRFANSLGLRHCLPMDPWYLSVSSMLDRVLEKGCTELHVTAGTTFSSLYYDDIPVQEPPEVTINPGRSSAEKESRFVRLRRKLPFNLFRRMRFPGWKLKTKDASTVVNVPAGVINDAGNYQAAPETQPASPPNRELRLVEVYIHSDMLLQHPFSQWTLLTLNAASSTITKLSLKLITEASSTWKFFAATLALPLLKEFSFMNNFFSPPDVAAFMDVEDFLVNHPQITNLYLYGVGLPPSTNAVPRPSFENLITFDAHPQYTIWLMNSLISNPAALPSLQRVVISSQNYDNPNGSLRPDFKYSLFDSGLAAVATFPRSVVLALTFNSRSYVEDWLHSHVRDGVGTSVVSRLVHIDTFSIYGSWSQYPEAMFAIIPDWVQLFPALKHLRFEREAQENMVKLVNPQYVATVALLCQKLETMSVNRETFDLELVRRNLDSGASD